MVAESDMWIHSASVVIVAEYHNPSILNKDFLVMHKIVPKEWNVVETAVTPLLTVIRYENGIRLQEDESRLHVAEQCDLPFREYTGEQLPNLASSYAQILPHVPYRGLGFNYTISVIRQDPNKWINDRFLKFNPWDKDFHMMPRFSVSLGGATLNLSIHGEKVSRKGSSQKSVVVDCNLHYGGQFNAVSLCDKLSGWEVEKKCIVDTLDKILCD